MPAAPILLLDVMDTLVHEPFFKELPAFFGLSLEELLAVKHPTSWIEFERGAITEREYLQRFFADGRPVDGEALRAHLRTSYRWIEGMEALVRELHGAGRAMHALSNYPAWYRLLDDTLGLSRYLAWTFVSCRTGLRKPDPAAYQGALASLQVDPDACLFVDDRRVNVEAARGQGLPALLFEGAVGLRAELRQRGLL